MCTRRLSGGQQQRVAIARALSMEPQGDAVRRADLGAGPRTDRRSAEVMKQAGPQGMTMLVVTHEMSFAREVADRAGPNLEDGQFIEVGRRRSSLPAPATCVQSSSSWTATSTRGVVNQHRLHTFHARRAHPPPCWIEFAALFKERAVFHR